MTRSTSFAFCSTNSPFLIQAEHPRPCRAAKMPGNADGHQRAPSNSMNLILILLLLLVLFGGGGYYYGGPALGGGIGGLILIVLFVMLLTGRRA